MTGANMKSLTKQLRMKLNRGVKVVIGETYPDPPMRGREMVLASKSVVKCNQKGRCAHAGCLGLAAFVTDQASLEAEKDKNTGWRSNTLKICLTHLRGEQGEELVPEPEDVVADPGSGAYERPASNSYERPMGSGVSQAVALIPLPPNRLLGQLDDTGIPSWEMINEAAAAGDHHALLRFARQLKTENDSLTRRLMEAQEKLLRSFR